MTIKKHKRKSNLNRERNPGERKRNFRRGFIISFLVAASWIFGREAGKVYFSQPVNGIPTRQEIIRTEDYSDLWDVNLIFEKCLNKCENISPNELEVKVDSNEPKKPGEPNELEAAYLPLEISQKGIELIKKYEDFSATPYLDADGFAIAWGHQIKKGENYNNITRQEGDALLIRDLKTVYEPAVRKHVKVSLTQGQYDALCSFVYNFGEEKLKRSTLLKKLNKGDYKGAADEFTHWINVYVNTEEGYVRSPLLGLVKRRTEERHLFLSN